MSANVRFSSHEAAGKKYLGGPLIAGSQGVIHQVLLQLTYFLTKFLNQKTLMVHKIIVVYISKTTLLVKPSMNQKLNLFQ